MKEKEYIITASKIKIISDALLATQAAISYSALKALESLKPVETKEAEKEEK